MACVSLWPGVVKTERLAVMGDAWPFPTKNAESPTFTGRAIAALATRPELALERSGSVQVVAELAAELGFTDVDGNTPRSMRAARR